MVEFYGTESHGGTRQWTFRLIDGYFGEPWPSGVCETGGQCPTPVGEPCAECAELIEVDQQGTFMGNGVWPDRPPIVPVHKECALRAVTGGIGHHEDHQRWCVFEHDPDGGRTYRQSALEVWARLTGEHR